MGWIACAFAACTGDSSGSSDDGGSNADAFWDEIHAAEYRSFDRAPGFETTQESEDGTHGSYVDIYVNATIADALDAGSPLTEWPEDSLIVKDGFRPEDELAYIAAMKKQSDGWYWAEWRADGSEVASGSPAVCTGCHEDSGNDFVWAFALP